MELDSTVTAGGPWDEREPDSNTDDDQRSRSVSGLYVIHDSITTTRGRGPVGRVRFVVCEKSRPLEYRTISLTNPLPTKTLFPVFLFI